VECVPPRFFSSQIGLANSPSPRAYPCLITRHGSFMLSSARILTNQLSCRVSGNPPGRLGWKPMPDWISASPAAASPSARYLLLSAHRFSHLQLETGFDGRSAPRLGMKPARSPMRFQYTFIRALGRPAAAFHSIPALFPLQSPNPPG